MSNKFHFHKDLQKVGFGDPSSISSLSSQFVTNFGISGKCLVTHFSLWPIDHFISTVAWLLQLVARSIRKATAKVFIVAVSSSTSAIEGSSAPCRSIRSNAYTMQTRILPVLLRCFLRPSCLHSKELSSRVVIYNADSLGSRP